MFLNFTDPEKNVHCTILKCFSSPLENQNIRTVLDVCTVWHTPNMCGCWTLRMSCCVICFVTDDVADVCRIFPSEVSLSAISEWANSPTSNGLLSGWTSLSWSSRTRCAVSVNCSSSSNLSAFSNEAISCLFRPIQIWISIYLSFLRKCKFKTSYLFNQLSRK